MSRVDFYLNHYFEIKRKVEADPKYFQKKEHTVPIYVDFTFGDRLRASTRIAVNPNDWDQEKQKIKASDPDAGPKNYRLHIIRSKLYNIETDAIRDNIKLTPQYIKSKLAPGNLIKGDAGSQKFFLDTWNKFTCLPNKSKGTRDNYDNTLAVIRDFCTVHNHKLSIEEITTDFYDNLLSYFFHERKLTRNTCGKYVKNIKAFMTYCDNKGYCSNKDYKTFEVFKDQQVITSLTVEELKKIKNLELETQTQCEARDLFLFQCFSGLRYSDTQRITPGCIRHGFISFSTVKTHKVHGTPLTAQANEILQRYDNCLPKMSIKTYNDALKLIGSKAGFNHETVKVRYVGSDRVEIKKPFSEFFSSHLAKRTFVSIFFRQGGRMETIMRTTGNTDRKTMKHYLEVESQDVKSEVDNIFGKIDI